ncbi:MAG: ribonuclease E/G [Eubacteriales bacterium]|nr:ribonuclease E/G [Eubacteriales bacterium]
MSTTYVITGLFKIRNLPDKENGLQAKGAGQKLCCCLLEDDRLTEVHIDQEGQTLLGNIYVGKVKNVLKNIDAAFVEIAGKRTCFLPLSEAQHPILTNRPADGRILAGDEILVQVQKDAVKTKDPVLTAKLSVPGKYVSVSLDGGSGIRYSHKLSQQEKARIQAALQETRVPPDMTAVIRTQAREISDLNVLTEELKNLLAQAEKLLLAGKTRTVFSLLTEKTPGYLRYLQTDLVPFPQKIVTDELSVFQTLQSYCQKNAPDRLSRLSFYQDDRLSLSGLYGLRTKLSEALDKNVRLKSGGYLVIEPTEALTVIDVNTGKYSGKKDVEETFWHINEEAAKEVARQLRLRNLSGIILVDFINMKKREEKQQLLSLLREACGRDPVPVTVVDMTALGLVEITRRKVSRPLAEQWKEWNEGKGEQS